MAQIKVTQKKMFLDSLGKMAAYLTVGTILLILYGYWRAKSIAQKMTKQVVTLYENLNEISQKSKGKQGGQRNVVELKFVPACKEMNALNLTYNKFAKIISLATTFDQDQNEKALLNYSEAFGIFEDFDDQHQQGVCLTNIGTIFMQKEDYDMAYVCFNESETYMNIAIEEETIRM